MPWLPPARRRAIIREQKRPRDVIVARYGDVYTTIAEFLVDGGRDYGLVEQVITELSNAKAVTEWEQQDNQLSAEALESFVDFAAEVDLLGLAARLAEQGPTLDIAGVAVSVRPEIMLSGTRAQDTVVGAIKVYISKNNPLGDVAGQYAATTLHQYLTDVMCPTETVDPRACMVLDVFAQQIYIAPRSFKRRRNDIQAACEEIARAWASA